MLSARCSCVVREPSHASSMRATAISAGSVSSSACAHDGQSHNDSIGSGGGGGDLRFDEHAQAERGVVAKLAVLRSHEVRDAAQVGALFLAGGRRPNIRQAQQRRRELRRRLPASLRVVGV